VMTAALAHVLVERGELEAAEAELTANGLAGALPDHMWFALPLFVRGQLRVEQGRFAEAAADFDGIARLAASGSGMVVLPVLQSRTYAVRAYAAVGDVERARALAEQTLAQARRWGAPSGVSRALRALSDTLDGDDRVPLLEEAVALLDGSPALLARLHALHDLGRALRRVGRRVDARPPLREALELARRCGASGVARDAAFELQATGEKVRRWTPIGVESLTPSERRVAELAASGMTNRQIAQTLFLTVKTIETHLAATYDKLGIRSRRALPTALGEQREGAAPTAAAAS